MIERKTYSIRATPEEQHLIDLVKQKTKRLTFSDLVRYLLIQEAEKFLPPNTLDRVATKVYSVK